MNLNNLGSHLLFLSFFTSIATVIFCVIGYIRSDGTYLRAARRGLLAVAVMVGCSSFILLRALINSDFSVKYVWGYTSLELPFLYKLSAFWAGNAGSLLFWTLAMSWMVLFGTRKVEATFDLRTSYSIYGLIALIETLFLFPLLKISSPFVLFTTWLPNGAGLNPLLQNLGMIFHPPLLFLGYAGFTIPFALALGNLVAGSSNADWIRLTRRWTLISWLFLTIGIVLGAAWAYVELGWGGYWAWDPVENASFLPWLTATAFLHSVILQQRRGLFKAWNISLVVITFLLCIFATYLTRSGVLSSLHAFGESTIGNYFLVFMGLITIFSLVIILARMRMLESEELSFGFHRETYFLANNFVFVLMAVVVFYGTMSPMIWRVLADREVTYQASFYVRTLAPLSIILVVSLGLCVISGWSRSISSRVAWRLLACIVTGFAVQVALWATKVSERWILIFIPVLTFALSAVLLDLGRLMMASNSSVKKSQGYRSIGFKPRQLGAAIIHLGMVLFLVGTVVSSVYNYEKDLALLPGESAALDNYPPRDYSIEYLREISYSTPLKDVFGIEVMLYEKNRAMALLNPRKDLHHLHEQPQTEVAIRTGLMEDVYVILRGFENGRAHISISVKPMVIWLWIGTGLIVIGGMIALIEPSRPRIQ